jgi:membrane protease YdiL (CAAX protease family)
VNDTQTHSESTPWFSSVRRTPGWFVALMILVFTALATFSNLVVSMGDILRTFCRTTGNLLHPTLCNYVPYFVVLALMWWKVGRLGPRDLGLDRSRLPAAIRWVLGFWVAAQLGFAAIHMGDVSINPVWDWGLNASATIGYLLGQLFGNAMCEELFWRAFVMTQLAALLHHRGWKPNRALIAAVFLSSILFALSHIPYDLALDRSLSQILVHQAAALGGGLVLSWLYALSGNLFLVVGMHSLMNNPVSIFDGYDTPWGQAFFAFGPLVLLTLLALRKRRS